MQRLLKNSIIGLALLLSLAAALLTSAKYSAGNEPYRLIWVLPISFIISFPFIQYAARGSKVSLTFIFYLVLSFLQSTLYPLLLALMPIGFLGRWYFFLNDSEISFAIMILAYGNIFNAIAAVGVRTIAQQVSVRELSIGRLQGSKVVYLITILIAIGLTFAIGIPSGLVSFFSAGGIDRDISTSFFLLVRQIIWIGMALLFVQTLNFSKNRYDLSGSKKYYWLSLAVAILLVSTIMGDRRSVQLFTTALVTWMLISAFPNHTKRTVFLIIGSGFFVILSITLMRGSIISAVQYAGGVGGLSYVFVNYLQLYAGGVDSIATSMRLASVETLGVQHFLFDMARLTFGPSFFLKGNGSIVSEIYNDFIYEGERQTGQVIFALSYGYLVFGVLGAPLITTLNLIYASVFEVLFRRTNSIELQFLFGYCFFRVAYNLLVNTPTIHSIVTLQLVTFGLVIGSAVLLKGLDRPYRKSLKKTW